MTFITSVIDIIVEYYPSIFYGVKTTLLLAIPGTIVGIILGLLIGGLKSIQIDKNAHITVKISKKIYDIIAKIYIEVFRGTPMMVQAVFIYYLVYSNIYQWTPYQSGLFIISINTGAYMAEIIRGGIQSVDKGQIEAARSLGLNSWKTLLHIVLPQAIKNAFPAIGNEFIVNIKDSSVLSVILVTDLMFQAKSISGSNFMIEESYFIIACVYLCLTLFTSVILNSIEKKYNHKQTSFPQSDSNINSITLTTERID